MTNPENRAIMIDLAVRWLQLAERVVARRPVQQQQQQQIQPNRNDKKEGE
jgi:hypothetical protein